MLKTISQHWCVVALTNEQTTRMHITTNMHTNFSLSLPYTLAYSLGQYKTHRQAGRRQPAKTFLHPTLFWPESGRDFCFVYIFKLLRHTSIHPPIHPWIPSDHQQHWANCTAGSVARIHHQTCNLLSSHDSAGCWGDNWFFSWASLSLW